MSEHPRLERERQTIEKMVGIFCRDVHRKEHGRCAECAELLDYAGKRLHRCPFQEEKPPCADCPIHCYQPARREQVKVVMRHAGPRMFLRHPIFALRHWLDSFKRAPDWPRKKA